MQRKILLPRTHSEWSSFLCDSLALPLDKVWFPEHFYLNQFKRRSVFKPQQAKKPTWANAKQNATLLLLSPVDNDFSDLCITVTRRTDNVRTHKGEMSFPGGRVEDGEDPCHAAQREAEEEIGVAADEYAVIGALTPIPVDYNNSFVTAFVALAPRSVAPHPASPDEVKSIHYLHLSNIIVHAPQTHARVIKYHSRTGRDEPSLFPCFFASDSQSHPSPFLTGSPSAAHRDDDLGCVPILPEDYPGELVWGLTSFMLSEFVARTAKTLELRNQGCPDYKSEAILRCGNFIARDPAEPPSAATESNVSAPSFNTTAASAIV